LDACDALVRDHTKQAVSQLSAFEDIQFMENLANELTSRTV